LSYKKFYKFLQLLKPELLLSINNAFDLKDTRPNVLKFNKAAIILYDLFFLVIGFSQPRRHVVLNITGVFSVREIDTERALCNRLQYRYVPVISAIRDLAIFT
jgi:hypothetical protein